MARSLYKGPFIDTHLLKKVEVAAAKEGKKDLQSRKEIAQKILEQTLTEDEKQNVSASASFDQLLKALKEDENFMLED